MPEIPELEAIAAVLNREATGTPIRAVEVRIPVVIRRPTQDEFVETLTGNTIASAKRRGKYLLLPLTSGHVLAIHFMLTGRLQLTEAGTRRRPRTSWIAQFEDGKELRYFSARMDGRVYLVPVDELSLIPRFDQMGPDVLDPDLTFEVFRQRIKRYPGQIKRSLVNEAFVSAVGNAYVNEILFEAGIYPFTKSKDLSEEQLQAVYDAIPRVYQWAIPIVAERMGSTINEKIRDFLKVHRKGGQPCPVCGSAIAEVSPNQRTTSWCRTCQPGGALSSR